MGNFSFTHSPSLMPSGNYKSTATLPGHTASVRVLRFSPNGNYLASGGEDGLVLVFSTDSWELVARIVNVSPVAALMWHSTFPKTITCGFISGAVVTICLDSGDRVRSLSSKHATCFPSYFSFRMQRAGRYGQTRSMDLSSVSLPITLAGLMQ